MTITNILVLNWNSAESVKNCLQSIRCSDNKEFRVILIDNFSTKNELLKIRQVYESFKHIFEIFLIENESNLGYCGGNNIGLSYVTENNFSGDILILNPDICVTKNTISEMKKVLLDDVGIVTVRTVNDRGEILYDSIKLNGFFQNHVITHEGVISTDYSQGSCMLINREIINKGELFDPRFFLYWEEVDFSLRVKALGYRLITTTSTFVTRNRNSDFREPLVFYYSVRNARLIKEKHKNLFTNKSYFFYLIKIFFLTFKFIFKPKVFTKILLNYFQALYDSFFHIYYSKSSISDRCKNRINFFKR